MGLYQFWVWAAGEARRARGGGALAPGDRSRKFKLLRKANSRGSRERSLLCLYPLEVMTGPLLESETGEAAPHHIKWSPPMRRHSIWGLLRRFGRKGLRIATVVPVRGLRGRDANGTVEEAAES